MRIAILSLLLFGCASRLQEAEEFAEACERKYPGQCADYWANVEAEQGRRDQRRAVAASRPRRQLGQAFRDGSAGPAGPTYLCRTDYMGGQICTPQ